MKVGLLSWDRFGRRLQAYWRPTTGSGSNYVDRVDYGYDDAGNRTYRNVRVDLIAGASLDERDQAYSYDGLDRVTTADQGTANDTTGLITTARRKLAGEDADSAVLALSRPRGSSVQRL